RPSVPAAIVRDATKSSRRQIVHLIFPSIGAQGPAVAEDNGLPRPPILEVQLRPIFRSESSHSLDSLISRLLKTESAIDSSLCSCDLSHTEYMAFVDSCIFNANGGATYLPVTTSMYAPVPHDSA